MRNRVSGEYFNPSLDLVTSKRRPQVIAPLTAINGVTAAILGLTLHFVTYMAESLRGAIRESTARNERRRSRSA